ncbi:MAG: hypothetical protein HY512_04290 [Candidatus Aenigmarchaeota archaeon]|nr:hypothetical protein [Candidatus Aenigmarchaeota archaeon]
MPTPEENARRVRNDIDTAMAGRTERYQGASAWDTVTYAIRTAVLVGAVVGAVGAYKGVNVVYTWLTKPTPVAGFPTDNYHRVTGFKQLGPNKARLVLTDVDDSILLGRQPQGPVTEEDLLNGYVTAAELNGVDVEKAERAARNPGSAGTLTPQEDIVSKAIGRYLKDGAPRGTIVVEVEGSDLDVFTPTSAKPTYVTSPSTVRENRVSVSPPGEEPFFRLSAKALELSD